MGCGSFKNTLNPIKTFSQTVKSAKSIAKADFKTAFKQTAAADTAYQGLRYGNTSTKNNTKEILKNPYATAAVAGVVSVVATPAAGAAVSAAGAAYQTKLAQKEAGKVERARQASFDQAFDNLGTTITEGLGEPEAEEEIPIERQFSRRRRVTPTLFSSGLGGGGGTLGRPTLYGGA